MVRRIGRVLLAGCLAAASANAEVTPRAVTFSDAIAAAHSAPAAAVTRHELAAAAALVDAAGAWPRPSMRVETNRLTARYVAGASVPLPVLGTVGAARRVAAAQAEVTSTAAVVRDRELVRAVMIAWITLARAEGEQAAAQETVMQEVELEVIARGRLAAGAGAEVDVSAAAAARARAELAAVTAERTRRACAAELAGTLGWDPQQPLTASGELPGHDLAGSHAPVAIHPDHAAGQRRIAAADALAAEARTLRLPSLAVEGQVAMSDPGTPGTDVMLALTFDLPVFARTGERVRAATAVAAAARASLVAIDAQLAASHVAAELRWQAANEASITLEQVITPAQERAAQLAAQAYREGARDLASALQANRDLSAVRAEVVAARAALATAWVDVQVASGGALQVDHGP